MIANNNKNRCLRPFVVLIFLFLTCILFAQQTYNLEIVFKKTNDPAAWNETFGMAISTAGDVNTDGYDDIIIGSPSGMIDGRCYLYYGGNPMDTISDMTFWGDTAGDGFAVSMCSGFLNNDTISDIIIGLQNGWVNYAQPGKIHIFYGGAGLDPVPDLVINGHHNTASFGCAVACGDINGDNYQDLVVGEVYYPNSFVCDGRTYVYYGGPLLDTIPDIVINGHNGECFGHTVGSGGDLNSDGFEDVVVGADENSESYGGAGKVYVFFGGTSMDTIPDCWLHGEGVNHYLGWWGVAMSKATNNYDMLITGTRSYPGGFPGYRPGKVYVLYGGSPMDTIVDLWKVGETDSSWLGNWVDGTRVNANTLFGDFLSGAPVEYQFNGRGYLWLGDVGADSIYDGFLQGNINYYGIGWRVASAGDVNGDGFDEVMFSNYAADSNKSVWVCRYTGPGIEEQRARSVEQKMNLEVNPNPFSKNLTMKFQIPNAKFQTNSKFQTSIKIFDTAGRSIKVFNYLTIQPFNEINWEGADAFGKIVPAGVYFVEVEAEGIKEVRKVVKIE